MNENISVEVQIKMTVAMITIISFSINIPVGLLQPSGIDRPKLEISRIQMAELSAKYEIMFLFHL